jgi:hypothetical protein
VLHHPLTRFPDDYLWISWVDREGPILASGYSFFENLPLALVLLLILQRFGRRQWGYISELSTDDHTVLLHPINTDGTLGEGEVSVNFYPEDRVHSAWSLLGRATAIVGAKKSEADDVQAAEVGYTSGHGAQGGADDSLEGFRSNDGGLGKHPIGHRTGLVPGAVVKRKLVAGVEQQFYQNRDNYRKVYADTMKSHNLILKVSWPEASRMEEWKIIEHAWALAKGDEFIKGHIPDAKYARDFDRYSTKHIRSFLGLQREGDLGTRTLRLIAMNRLWPIYDLDGEQFWTASLQCIACASGVYHPV